VYLQGHWRALASGVELVLIPVLNLDLLNLDLTVILAFL